MAIATGTWRGRAFDDAQSVVESNGDGRRTFESQRRDIIGPGDEVNDEGGGERATRRQPWSWC